jgi:putative acetyltransferase
MSTELIIRKGNSEDLETLKHLFVDTVNTICSKDYSKTQLEVWTAASKNNQRWSDLMTHQYVLVAEQGNKIVGFGSLDQGDYIDFLYVHKDYQRMGIAFMIYKALETEAFKQGKKILYSDVSKTAKSFFEKQGFRNIQEQIVERQGTTLLNFKMTKSL